MRASTCLAVGWDTGRVQASLNLYVLESRKEERNVTHPCAKHFLNCMLLNSLVLKQAQAACVQVMWGVTAGTPCRLARPWTMRPVVAGCVLYICWPVVAPVEMERVRPLLDATMPAPGCLPAASRASLAAERAAASPPPRAMPSCTHAARCGR